MVASLLRIVHSGPQNERLNQQPQAQPNTKFFKKLFIKAGRFTTQWERLDFNKPLQFGQQATAVLPRKGHLLSRVYLVANYPTFSNFTTETIISSNLVIASNTIFSTKTSSNNFVLASNTPLSNIVWNTYLPSDLYPASNTSVNVYWNYAGSANNYADSSQYTITIKDSNYVQLGSNTDFTSNFPTALGQVSPRLISGLDLSLSNNSIFRFSITEDIEPSTTNISNIQFYLTFDYIASNIILASNSIIYTSNRIFNPSWTNSVGHALIQGTELQIGGARIERLDGHLLEVLDEFNTPLEKVPVVNRLIGRSDGNYGPFSNMTSNLVVTSNIDENFIYTYTSNYITTITYKYGNPLSNPLTTTTPLPFFFNRGDPAAALPVDAIQADEIRVQMNLRPFSALITNYPDSQDFYNTLTSNTYVYSNYEYYTYSSFNYYSNVLSNERNVGLIDSLNSVLFKSNTNTFQNLGVGGTKTLFANNTWVITGNSGIYTSLDNGSTWQQTNSNRTNFIEYGNGYWAATTPFINNENKIFYSSNALDWYSNTYISNEIIYQSISYNSNSNYWLVGTTDMIYKFTDMTAAPISSNANPAASATNKLLWNGTQWLGIFNEGVYYSYDGAVWNAASNLTIPGYTKFFSLFPSGADYGGGRWMICGQDRSSNYSIYTSIDGSNFSVVNTSFSNLIDIKYYNSNWICADTFTNSFYISRDITATTFDLFHVSSNTAGGIGILNQIVTYSNLVTGITSNLASNTISSIVGTYSKFNTISSAECGPSNAAGTTEGSANFPLTSLGQGQGQGAASGNISLGDAYLLAEYIYLDAPEANRFRLADITLPITQHYPLQPLDTQGLPQAQIQINAPNPVRDIFFYCQPWLAPAYNAHFLATKYIGSTPQATQPWWPDASGLNALYPSSLKPAFWPDINDSEPITSIALQYEGRLTKFSTENTALFRQILPSLEQKKAPWVNRYYYNIPFGVQHGITPLTQPTGEANYDKITRRELQLTFPKNSANGSSPRLWVRPYVETYNILRIYGGRAGTLFGY
jgi:hypothetical protein